MCQVVASGNDYIDYWATQAEDQVIHKDRWNLTGPMGTTIIIIFTIALCVFCGGVCYYNY